MTSLTLKSVVNILKEILNVDMIIFADAETFYADTNKVLRENAKGKMTRVTYKLGPANPVWKYAMDELFQFTGFCYALDDDPTIINPETKDLVPIRLRQFADQIQEIRNLGNRVALVAHNANFDGGILAWHYGVEFDEYVDTMAIEKMFDSNKPANLGASIARYSDDHAKTDELSMADGVRLEDMSEEIYAHQVKYCKNDVSIMRELLAHQVYRGIPPNELQLMSITARGACIPQFVVEPSLLREVIVDDKKDTDSKVLAAANHCFDMDVKEVSPATFSSNPKYAGLLQKLGLSVPQKKNKDGDTALALGKTDPPYVKLQIDNPEHADVYAAREKVKSTIARTRAEKMILASSLFKMHTTFDADLPMFLKYYGAENTGRWSAGEGLNQQNLQRKSKHRRSLKAKKNHKIAVTDLSQIELRMTLWFCGQEDILEEYRKNPNYDVYVKLAEDIYKRPIDKAVDTNERGIGKAGSLGLGFAMSWFGFQQYLAGGPLGLEPTFVSNEFAMQVKWSYESRNFMIAKMWMIIESTVLPILANGGTYSFGPNDCVTVTKDKITLPSGRVLHYPNTRMEHQGNEHSFKVRYICDTHKGKFVGVRGIWHGLIIENIIQALSRDVLGFQMVLIEDQLYRNGYGSVIGSVHDEVLAMVQTLYADASFDIMTKIMAMRPWWCPDLPLASEGGYDDCYSK